MFAIYRYFGNKNELYRLLYIDSIVDTLIHKITHMILFMIFPEIYFVPSRLFIKVVIECFTTNVTWQMIYRIESQSNISGFLSVINVG